MEKLVVLKATGKEPGRVALWDKHPSHPGMDHEIYIADGGPPERAAKTVRVMQAVADQLVEIVPESAIAEYWTESIREQRRMKEYEDSINTPQEYLDALEAVKAEREPTSKKTQ